jgi:hypothetical protein
MKFAIFVTFTALVALSITGCKKSGQGGQQGAAEKSAKSIELLNVSYDPTRELWRDINANFIPKYEKENGVKLTINQSHGMEAVGADEELAALNLGANGWQMFWDITVPNIKWGLVYGIILCNARAVGEFGAVYVVSGHIAGQTDTMPLRIEKLFQEYNLPGSFAVASVLTLLAIVTLIAKAGLERKLPTTTNLPESDVHFTSR